jgi:hypothetical protein
MGLSVTAATVAVKVTVAVAGSFEVGVAEILGSGVEDATGTGVQFCSSWQVFVAGTGAGVQFCNCSQVGVGEMMTVKLVLADCWFCGQFT